MFSLDDSLMRLPVLPLSLRPGRGPRGADNESRVRMLDAAASLFAQRGIANTTVAQIALRNQPVDAASRSQA